MALPRPPLGPPGEEKTPTAVRRRRDTHPQAAFDERLYIAEERAAAAEQAVTSIGIQNANLSEKIDRLAAAVDGLTDALKGPEHRLEDGIAWKVADLYGWKKIFVRVGISVLTASLIGALAWIAVLYKKAG